jgi:hypothetical protein
MAPAGLNRAGLDAHACVVESGEVRQPLGKGARQHLLGDFQFPGGASFGFEWVQMRLRLIECRRFGQHNAKGGILKCDRSIHRVEREAIKCCDQSL